MVRKFTLSILLVVCVFFSVSFSQGKDQLQIKVMTPVNHDLSIPLKEMREIPLNRTAWKDGIIPLRTIRGKNNIKFNEDLARQQAYNVLGIGSLNSDFDGVSAQGYAPPDVSGDVGPNYYMQMVNVRLQIWDKFGNSLYGPVNLGTLWSGFPGPWASSLNDGDPVVLYDDMADRWLASEFSLPNGGNGPEYILVAISQTSDPTGAWYRYGFEMPQFPDYPKFGVWSDGYYMSANRFAPSYTGTYAAAFQRDSMLVGGAANMVLVSNSSTTTFSLLPSDCDGIAPPVGAPNYFVQGHDNADYGGNDGLDVFEFHVDWNNPASSTFTGPTFLSVSSFAWSNGIPQQSPGSTLDDISDRLMQRLQYRNFGDHESMVVCQTVDAGSGRAGVRWYELRNTGGAGWSVYQQATYAPNDGLGRWMGSVAMNEDGDIALGYSVSSSSMTPEIRFTGRRNGDPLNQMTVAEETIITSGGVQSGGLTRWGDYTTMSIDPDGRTFWYTGEYIPGNGSFNWKTRISSFKFGPPCPIDFPSDPTPADTSTGVDINLSQLSWTNGAGASQLEVWFGEAGNVAKVYDGGLVTSWSIPSALTYNTKYNWKIIEKNDTCNVVGTQWSFTTMTDPSIVNLFIDPFNDMNNWTAVSPNDYCDWQLASGDIPGSVFGAPNFPPTAEGSYMVASSDACGTTLSMNKYLNGSFTLDISSWQTAWIEFDSDFEVYSTPSPPDTAKVQISIDGGSTWATVFEHNNTTTPEEHAIVDISSLAALQNNVKFRLGYYGDYSWHWAIDNFAVYATTVVPVELTAFNVSAGEKAVTLDWSTATETNNQGFEIQRKASTGDFIKVGYVPGYGTTTKPRSYSFVDENITTGTYTYRLKQIDFSGAFKYSDELNVKMNIPLQYELDQNYPNPFNPATTIKYSIPEDGFVKLEVYNLLGESVATLINGMQKAGRYEVNFNASNLSSGIYIYKLKSGKFNSVKKMLLMK